MKEFLKKLNQRPIAFYPVYADIGGGIKEGLLLSQIMYWWSVCGDDEFYKTDREFMHETRLGTKELRNAKNTLKSLGFIEIIKRGVPGKNYYRPNLENIEKGVSSSAQTAELEVPKGHDKYGPNGRSSIQETTTETTTERISGEVWNSLIDPWEKLNPMFRDFYRNKTERNALQEMMETPEIGYENLKVIIEDVLPQIVNIPYAPKITRPTELRRDMGKLKAFYNQEKSKIKSNRQVFM